MFDPNDTKTEGPQLPEAAPIQRSQVSAVRRVRSGTPRHRQPLEASQEIPPDSSGYRALAQNRVAEVHKAQLELAREKNRRLIDAAEAEARLSTFRRDLEFAQKDIAALRESVAGKPRTAIIGLVAIILTGSFLIYRSLPAVNRVAGEIHPRFATPPKPLQQDGPQTRFANGLDRLNYTLELAARDDPDETPDRAMRMVHAANPALCPFLWKNGQVSLIFDGATLNLDTLADKLSRCADAVGQLPAK